ncbi:MAG: hypothetical protein HKO53_02945 [Gemmatimonadetes bacterium]|nr:hypothetical protein [Gemmatimonadota bacterium]
MSAESASRRFLVRKGDEKRPERWRRSQGVAARAQMLDGADGNGSHPAAEVERILREYACECYAVGRGESMYYLVEDLPRLAREATGEILELQAMQTKATPIPRLPHFEPKARKSLEAKLRKSQLLLPNRKVAAAKGTAKSLVAALPFIAMLAVIGLTIGLTFREFVSGG